MPRPPLASSPSEPSPRPVLGTSASSSVIRSSVADAPTRSPAPAVALEPAKGGRPSLPNGGAASSPAIATMSGSPSSSSVGDRLGNGDRSTTTASDSATTSSTPGKSSDGFPTLGEVDLALQDAVPAESGTAGSRSTEPPSAQPVVVRDRLAPNVLGMVLEAQDGAQGGAPPSHVWTPPPPASSALGMIMGGLPLALQLSNGPFDPTARRTGICKFFNASKGFGFILDHNAHELGNDEVFVHYTVIAAVSSGTRGFKSLLEGEAVEYSIVQGPKGWQAHNVTGPNGAPCIGTPPSGIPKPSLVPSSGSPQSKNGMRRPSVASSAFASPMRSTPPDNLYGSSLADDSSRTSLGSPTSRPLRLHMGGQGPPYSNGGLPPSPHLFQPVIMDPYGSPMQHHPPPLPFHLPPFPHDGEQSPHGAPYYGSPDAGALVHSPMAPGFGSPYSPMHPLGPPPPGMDAYPISSSVSQGPPLSPLHAYPSPTSPFFLNGYPISNSPTSPQYPPLPFFSGPSPYSPYPAFLPGMPGPPPPSMYFDPSSGPPSSPPGLVQQAYPISSAGESGGPGGGPPAQPASAKVVDAPSGMAIGWAEDESSPVDAADGGAPALDAAAPRTATKQPAPLPGAERPASASA
ncbi:hypothetical protein JCM3775_001979 [Rhodotorula graminis]